MPATSPPTPDQIRALARRAAELSVTPAGRRSVATREAIEAWRAAEAARLGWPARLAAAIEADLRASTPEARRAARADKRAAKLAEASQAAQFAAIKLWEVRHAARSVVAEVAAAVRESRRPVIEYLKREGA